jgi:hypothetical protein
MLDVTIRTLCYLNDRGLCSFPSRLFRGPARWRIRPLRSSETQAQAPYGAATIPHLGSKLMPVLRNPRHEKFSKLVASGVSASESYAAVGYKPTGAKQAASRLLTNVDVRERVSKLQQAAARSTADSVILNRERVLHRLSQLSHEAQELIGKRDRDVRRSPGARVVEW